MSDTNRIGLAYIKETTFGTTPSGNLQRIRFTSESLKQETGTTTSNEIRTDRQVPDVVRNSISGAGGIDWELSYSTQDWLFEGAMLSADKVAEVTVITSSANVAVTSGAYELSTGSWTNTPSAGDWVEVRGFTTNTSNNGYFRVTSSDSNTITVDQSITDETEGDDITIKVGAKWTNGTTKRSYSIEKEFADLSSTFEATRGMNINELSMSVSSDGIVTGSTSFLGKSASAESSTIGTGYTAATTTSVMNAIDHVLKVEENDASLDITSFAMTLGANLRGRGEVGTLGAASVGTGSIALSGTLTAYVADNTLYTKYLNYTATKLAVVFEDGSGNAIVIDMPEVKYTDGQRLASGKDGDALVELSWEAFRDSTLDRTIAYYTFDA